MSTETLKTTIPTPKLNKIPGEIPHIRAEKKVHTKEFNKYTKIELEELLERQTKLLSNKSRLSKLPDKGKRIQDFHDLIVQEIAKKDEIDVTSEMFSDLNIATKGASKLTNMKWNGLPPEPQLITSADLDEIKSFSSGLPIADSVDSSNNSDLEPHALHMCEVESHKKNKPKFLPHKTTKSDCHSLEKEKGRRHGKHWEITAATPPTIRNSEAQVLSLQESISIQREQYEHLKEIEKKHAEERLAVKNQLAAKIRSGPELSDRNLNSFFTKYRDVVDKDNGSDDDDDPADVDSDDQVHDDDDCIGGGVTVVQYDD